MKAEAEIIEELFKGAGEKEDLIRELDSLISSTVTGLKRLLYKGNSMNMSAYGLMPYKTIKSEYEWPVIGLAPQKGSVNLYVSGLTCGAPIAEYYQEKLGKVSAGKSCIRIKKMKDLDLEEFKKMLKDAENWFIENPEGNKG